MDRFFELVEREFPTVRLDAYRRYLDLLFSQVDIQGSTFLDVGAGYGLFSLYAARRGAARVVALEPASDSGGYSDMIDRFREMAAFLGETKVELVPSTFQEYAETGERFDVTLLHNSINHLDEPACVRLHTDPQAQQSYRVLFTKLAELAEDGGRLLVTDCTRHNFFGQLGLRNPLAPSIEWDKHQPPGIWARHLGEAGFQDPTTVWIAPSRLGGVGQAVLGNPLGAYFTGSRFLLAMTRARR